MLKLLNYIKPRFTSQMLDVRFQDLKTQLKPYDLELIIQRECPKLTSILGVISKIQFALNLGNAEDAFKDAKIEMAFQTADTITSTLGAFDITGKGKDIAEAVTNWFKLANQARKLIAAGQDAKEKMKQLNVITKVADLLSARSKKCTNLMSFQEAWLSSSSSEGKIISPMKEIGKYFNLKDDGPTLKATYAKVISNANDYLTQYNGLAAKLTACTKCSVVMWSLVYEVGTDKLASKEAEKIPTDKRRYMLDAVVELAAADLDYATALSSSVAEKLTTLKNNGVARAAGFTGEKCKILTTDCAKDQPTNDEILMLKFGTQCEVRPEKFTKHVGRIEGKQVQMKKGSAWEAAICCNLARGYCTPM